MSAPDPVDERRHPHDEQPLWNESYYLDWFDDAGELGGYVRVGVYPNLGRVWYWACLVGPGRDLITVIDHDVELPPGKGLELRHDGLWADHTVETPLEHMSVNLEAFGLQLDDPVDVYRGGFGHRVPFGFELDFHTDRAAYLWPPVTPRYEIPCRVRGRVLVGDDEIEIDGWGQRDHSWGASRDWWSNQWCWSAGRLDDGTRFHTTGALLPDSNWGVAYLLPPDTSEFAEFDVVDVETTLDAEGLATAATLRFGPMTLSVEPLAWSPVLLTHADGRLARFPRAMARFTSDDGSSGVGWIEWNQSPNQPPTT